jgi:hypothetical protein
MHPGALDGVPHERTSSKIGMAAPHAAGPVPSADPSQGWALTIPTRQPAPSGPIVAVAHGGTIRAAIALALNLPPQGGLAFAIENCASRRRSGPFRRSEPGLGVDHPDAPTGAVRAVVMVEEGARSARS